MRVHLTEKRQGLIVVAPCHVVVKMLLPAKFYMLLSQIMKIKLEKYCSRNENSNT
jgi:hypothetical protein